MPLLSICLGFFIVMLDTTIVNLAIADIGRQLHVGVTLLQWVLDAYTLTFAAFLLSAGALGDGLGARRVFLAGLLLFGVTSAACALAPTGLALIAARAVQGLAAAILVPTSLALINATYSERSDRARAIGVWGGMGGIAAAAGPVLGGVLITAAGWRTVFLVNVPVTLIALVLVRAFVVDPPSRAGAGIHDYAGQVLAVAALALVTFAIIDGAGGRVGVVTAACLVAGGALAVAFMVVEARTAQPMFPVGLLRQRSFSGAVTTGLLLNFGFYGQLFVLSLYFQLLRGYRPLIAGLMLVPQTATAIVGSTLGGRVTARTGPALPIVIGLATGVTGFAAMLFVGPGSSYGLILLPMIAAGLGTAFTMPAATAAAIEAAPKERAGAASGVLNAARQVGGVLGVAVLGGTIAKGQPFIPGFHEAVLGAAAAFLIAIAVNLLTWPRPPQTPATADLGVQAARHRTKG
jgi:MFS transporter, DHA2 family, methylenomycin A resistance protein